MDLPLDINLFHQQQRQPELPRNRESEAILTEILNIIIKDMKNRIAKGKPGPAELDLDRALQLIEQGTLEIRLAQGNPPRPELVVAFETDL